MTNDPTVWLEPRSTCRVLVPDASEQNLLSRPSLPSNAIAGPSVDAHEADPVAGLPSARFGPRSGAAAGWVAPSVKDGGTFAGSVPQEDGEGTIVYDSVAPLAMSGYRSQVCWVAAPFTDRLCTYWFPSPAPVPLIWMLPA